MVNPEIMSLEEQSTIWDYYKPRQTHSWNMLVLSYRELDELALNPDGYSQIEYYWENFILRLWLFRTSIRTLEKIPYVATKAKSILSSFDGNFTCNKINQLRALRNIIEHWDEYAAGKGHGPASRSSHLDPWREVSKGKFERGDLTLLLLPSYEAAIKLLEDAKSVSKIFTDHYKSQKNDIL